MHIIDCRCRPDTPEYFRALEGEGFRTVFRKAGNPLPEFSVTLRDFVEKFQAEGVSRIVCTGRDMGSVGGFSVSNEYVAAMVAEHPGNIVGVAGIDPMKGEQAVRDVEHAIVDLKLKGVSMDPAMFDWYANDPRLYPIYQKCADLDVPVFLTIGPLPVGAGKLRYTNPLAVDDVAADFPRLRMLCSHGGFPWTQEMIAVAWRHEHVYFETSVYWGLPGVELIVDAANTIIGDKLCFASAYPFSPIRKALDTVARFAFREEVLPKFYHENAERLLGLD